VAALPLRFRYGEDAALTVIGVAAWALVALSAAAVGYHLRSLDDRRHRSVLEARQAQRLQLASDLHDFVAHDVSEMLALAQAGSMIAAAQPDHAELFTMIEQAAQRALRSMDQTVHMLHAGEDADGGMGLVPAGQDLAQLPELARRFQAANGVVVHLDVAPLDTLRVLPTTVSAVLYRVAVEALTNVRRHAPTAHAVDILVRRRVIGDADDVAMTIVNDGDDAEPSRPPDGIARRNGLGLPAMAARVAELGGTMTAAPCRPNGWRIDVTVPWSGGRGES
jgi:signal transduction histidine kinase